MYNGYRLGLPFKFPLAHFGMIVVGSGSWLFHMTLKYSFQLLDELPMLYGTAFQIYNLFTIWEAKTSNMTRYLLITGLVLYSAIVTFVYVQVVDPTFHQVAYGLMVATVVIRCATYFHIQMANDFHGMASKSNFPSLNVKSLRKQSWPLLFLSGWAFGVGFFAWNIDNIYCSDLRVIKDRIGLPGALALELHGTIWHTFTCYACYCSITFVEWVSIVRNNYAAKDGRPLALLWKFGIIPYVAILNETQVATYEAKTTTNGKAITNDHVNGKASIKANGKTNGHAKSH